MLVALCTFDMLFTLYCVRAGLAKEANPVLQQSLARSDSAFLFIKGASFLVPITILEFIRHRRPSFVVRALRFGFVAYAVIYVVGSIALAGKF